MKLSFYFICNIFKNIFGRLLYINEALKPIRPTANPYTPHPSYWQRFPTCSLTKPTWVTPAFRELFILAAFSLLLLFLLFLLSWQVLHYAHFFHFKIMFLFLLPFFLCYYQCFGGSQSWLAASRTPFKTAHNNKHYYITFHYCCCLHSHPMLSMTASPAPRSCYDIVSTWVVPCVLIFMVTIVGRIRAGFLGNPSTASPSRLINVFVWFFIILRFHFRNFGSHVLRVDNFALRTKERLNYAQASPSKRCKSWPLIGSHSRFYIA